MTSFTPFDTGLLNFVSLFKILCTIVIIRKKKAIYVANIFGKRVQDYYYWACLFPYRLSKLDLQHSKVDCGPARCRPVLYSSIRKEFGTKHTDKF